ncbi:MAG: FlgD immunoglobulin-like domain containing protein, partial [Candidatus Latescibacterota bacterium]
LGEFEVPAIAPIERSLPSGATLQVQVRDAAGQPAMANLALVRNPRELHGLSPGDALVMAYLGDDGRAEIPVAPGRYALAAYGSDAAGNSLPLGRVLTGLEVQGTLPVEVILPSPETTVRLSGQVRDSRDGSAVTALLQFCDEDQGIAARVSSEDGAYQVDLPPGTYGLTAALKRSDRPAEIFAYGPVEIRADSTWDILLGAGGTAVSDDAEVVPRAFALGRSYPNPFNGQTRIPYALPVPGRVELIVYNLAGQVVRRLVTEEQEAGTHLAAWDGRDEQGRSAASGVYLCRMKAGTFQQVQRLVLLR